MGKIENKNASERFDQMHSSKINRMFWIGTSLFTENLDEVLKEFIAKDWEEVFPDIYKSEKYATYLVDDDVSQALLDHNKLGFLAEVSVPQCYNFQFVAGKAKPIKWAVDSSVSRFIYCYAETPEELIDKIERKVEVLFMEDITKQKTEKQNTKNI